MTVHQITKTHSHTMQSDLPANRKVTIDSNTLEMILRMNGVGLSLTGDLVCDIRRALGENPNEPN